MKIQKNPNFLKVSAPAQCAEHLHPEPGHLRRDCVPVVPTVHPGGLHLQGVAIRLSNMPSPTDGPGMVVFGLL